jgi:MoaA/NifB/PqqE/SkfB family radical SAM enzyme
MSTTSEIARSNPNETKTDKTSRRQQRKVSFEYHLVEHCNLNCRSCSHFSTLAETSCLDIDTFEKDLRQMRNIFGDTIEKIGMCGGEPLLHPNIKDFLETAYSLFPYARRRIMTNGILLDVMPPDFWETVKRTQTTIQITVYPVRKAFNVLREIDATEGVSIIVDSSKQTQFRQDGLDLTGSQNPKEQRGKFICCYSTQLNRGRLYLCPKSAYFKHFNRYFDCGIVEARSNYLDIYKVADKQEVFEFFDKPADFCRYCDFRKSKMGIKWSVSNYEKQEWVEAQC